MARRAMGWCIECSPQRRQCWCCVSSARMKSQNPDDAPAAASARALSPLGQMVESIRPSNRLMSEDERLMVAHDLFRRPMTFAPTSHASSC